MVSWSSINGLGCGSSTAHKADRTAAEDKIMAIDIPATSTDEMYESIQHTTKPTDTE